MSKEKASVPSHHCLSEQGLKTFIFNSRREDLFQIENSRFLEFWFVLKKCKILTFIKFKKKLFLVLEAELILFKNDHTDSIC